MKTLLSLASSLALTCWLLPAHAQTVPATTPRSSTPAQAKASRPQTAERRADSYQGPKVVEDSKELGQKMIGKSKPADAVRMRASQLK